MSTTGGRDKRDTQNRILAAATELFIAGGYERTTVRDVAERAGVSRTTVFWHFSDKASLFRESFSRILEEFRESFSRRSRPPSARVQSPGSLPRLEPGRSGTASSVSRAGRFGNRKPRTREPASRPADRLPPGSAPRRPAGGVKRSGSDRNRSRIRDSRRIRPGRLDLCADSPIRPAGASAHVF